MAKLWSHGFTATKSLKGITGPGLYFSAYLADMELTEAIQVSKLLDIGKNTAYDLIRSGAIKNVRVGRQIRVSKVALLEFLGQKD